MYIGIAVVAPRTPGYVKDASFPLLTFLDGIGCLGICSASVQGSVSPLFHDAWRSLEGSCSGGSLRKSTNKTTSVQSAAF